MAESYATEADLRRAFNSRIALLDDTIKATQLSIGGLRQSLISLLRQAGEAELVGKRVPANLTGTITTQHNELIAPAGDAGDASPGPQRDRCRAGARLADLSRAQGS
jgi:hypothetical protein